MIIETKEIVEETGINRNILECKEILIYIRVSTFMCINRNILECKETIIIIINFSSVSINRNILECKDDVVDAMQKTRQLY